MNDDKKIKICFVQPFACGLFNPEADLKFGGAEVQMYLIAKELARDGNFDVNFIVLDIGQKSGEVYERVKLFKAYRRGRSWLNLIIAPLKLISVLRKINPEIVVCRAAGAEVGLAAIYAKLFRKKFIYSFAHDKDVDGSFFSGLRGKFFKFGFDRADRLVAQTFFQAEEFKKRYGKKAAKLEIIKNSLEIKESADPPSDQKKTILWVGSSAPLKRPEIFLDLAVDFPQEKFVMIITKSKLGLDLWDKIAARSKNIPNLKFEEKIPFAERDGYYAKAKVFISTAAAEGFANVFLEAANAWTPILSLKVDPDGFIDEFKAGFVAGGNYKIMKDRLAELLGDENLRRQMGENAYRYLKKEHDIKVNIKKWKKVFLSF
jgi:glycosyltransferase involved in cell wall biosynthesis